MSLAIATPEHVITYLTSYRLHPYGYVLIGYKSCIYLMIFDDTQEQREIGSACVLGEEQS
jgi:hypothetical protein